MLMTTPMTTPDNDERQSLPTTPARILSSRDAARQPQRLLGGKAINLAALESLGVAIPPWFCVTAAVHEDVLSRCRGDIDGVLHNIADIVGGSEKDRDAIAHASRNIATILRRTGLRDRDRSAIEDGVKALLAQTPSADRVAVRSSAIGEDSEHSSFAGQMDTYLYVEAGEVCDRIIDCMSSVYSERALLYRCQRGIAATDMFAATIIQVMIDSHTAGVLFTADPTAPSPAPSESGSAFGATFAATASERVVIAAAYGLGEGVVAGTVDCDTFYADRTSGVLLDSIVNEKRERVVRASQGGTYLQPVPQELANAPCLRPEQVRSLVDLGNRVEAHQTEAESTAGAQRRGRLPQDIEWAFDDRGTLYLLQARAITTPTALTTESQSQPPPTMADAETETVTETILDNANIVESFPGLVSPLTFSVARASYEEIFRESAKAQGIDAEVFSREPDIHANLLALVEGRVYYNLSNWYRRFGHIPGANRRIPAWEKAMGIVPSGRERAPGPKASIAHKLRALGRRAGYLLVLERRVQAFLDKLAAAERAFAALDLASMDSHRLLASVEQVMGQIRAPYFISLINDSFAQVFYHQLGNLLERWRIDDDGALKNALLCGERGMESVAPVRSLVAIAEAITRDERLLALVSSPPPNGTSDGANDGASDGVSDVADDSTIWQQLIEATNNTPLGDNIAHHLDRYGDRVLHELKIETPSLRERPQDLLPMVRNYLRGGQSIDEMEMREREIRQGAEATLERALQGKWLRAQVIRLVLSGTRRTLKNRENLRLARTRAMGLIKRSYRKLGRRFYQERMLADAGDIVYLSAEEIAAIVRGSALTREIDKLIQQRKSEYQRFAAQPPPPPRIVVRGVVHGYGSHQLDNTTAAPPITGARAAGDTAAAASQVHDRSAVLRGVGCSPGTVRGIAKVVTEPRGNLRIDGEILVAPTTDPGWVFLMVAAKGLISERGSALSHTAIIGRELGIPTVVGVPQAIAAIPDGATVTIDGRAGTVQIESPTDATNAEIGADSPE